MANILVIHGPNLNLLGMREPDIYGSVTLGDINTSLQILADQLGHNLSLVQSNSECLLIEHIHQAAKNTVDFIIFNPAAFTHTSIALRDALAAVAIPFIEVHLSNIYSREDFRRQSYFSDIAKGSITGLGALGYSFALRAAHEFLTAKLSGTQSRSAHFHEPIGS
jgi:3-dehydroquinate dehydratase-2